MASLADIARAVGISPSTASRALNRPDWSDQKLARAYGQPPRSSAIHRTPSRVRCVCGIAGRSA
ncbi:MAG: LacI family DNA-binding transcriptional regulator [Chloroflexi bacterium]|nr:LacI family DNA-binding transcriptional regulator [Chloroflexota bacterium]